VSIFVPANRLNAELFTFAFFLLFLLLLSVKYLIECIMKVSELMTKKLVTVTQDDMLDKVFIHFYFGGIRHIPVVTAKGTLVGIISDRDTRKMLGPRQTSYVQEDGTVLTVSARKVRTIMRRQPITIGPNEKAADAAVIMVKNNIGALPVTRNKKLVGIITATDVLKAFVNLSNMVDKFSRSLEK
jgi:CBS domain-containing protein